MLYIRWTKSRRSFHICHCYIFICMKPAGYIFIPQLTYEFTTKLHKCCGFVHKRARSVIYRPTSLAAPCRLCLAYEYIATPDDAWPRALYMICTYHCRHRDRKYRCPEAWQDRTDTWRRRISWINQIKNIISKIFRNAHTENEKFCYEYFAKILTLQQSIVMIQSDNSTVL